MIKKNKTINFFPHDPNNPLFTFVGAAANNFFNRALEVSDQLINKEMTKRVFGDQRIEETDFEKIKRETELIKAQTEKLKAEEQLRTAQAKSQQDPGNSNKATQSANIRVERSEIDLHVKTEVISGSLNTVANSSVLTSSPEQSEKVKEWQRTIPRQVVLLLGGKGSGKTATALALCELLEANLHYFVYWVGVPTWVGKYLPSWIRIVNDLDKVPNNSIAFIDETGARYLSLHFAGKHNLYLRQQLMLCRQRNITLIFCAQNSRDIDESIIRQCSCTIFKEPSLYQSDSERSEIKPRALKATQVFKSIPQIERISAAYVFDENFEGLIKCSTPSFWCEELSSVYGQPAYSTPPGNNRPQNGNDNGTIYLGPAVSDQQIRELRLKGYGYERISKTLGCTVYRVRQCLAEQDAVQDSTTEN